MLIAGAVCPHPPSLIPPAPDGDTPPELRKVADAAALAVGGLLAARPDLLVVTGGGGIGAEHGPDAAGTLAGHGLDITIGTGEPVLPLSLTIGRWLLERARVVGPAAERAPEIVFQAVSTETPAAGCVKLGAALADRAPRVAVLAMGDASACRASGQPGRRDLAAQEYDEDVAEALAAADARWLAKLDPVMDSRFAVAGRAAWQVLAGAAGKQRMHGRLLCLSCPAGITYLVATWENAFPDGTAS